jgi:hypothetical protein
MRKKAVVTFELVDESVEETDKRIEEELRNWLQEDVVTIPWVRDVKDVSVKSQ